VTFDYLVVLRQGSKSVAHSYSLYQHISFHPLYCVCIENWKGRKGREERTTNHYISSSRNSSLPDSAAGNHCESHPTFRLQHTWCSRCMCCSRAARGCLGVPLLLRRSFAPALTHFCQRQLCSILCSVPSIAQCIVLNSLQIDCYR
jgi:predicted molibdopterin-dependent oxidoreductase YjgC